MPINAAWHRMHRMPRNATAAQRLQWHEAHARHCDCRPFTSAMRLRLQRDADQAAPHRNAPHRNAPHRDAPNQGAPRGKPRATSAKSGRRGR